MVKNERTDNIFVEELSLSYRPLSTWRTLYCLNAISFPNVVISLQIKRQTIPFLETISLWDTCSLREPLYCTFLVPFGGSYLTILFLAHFLFSTLFLQVIDFSHSHGFKESLCPMVPVLKCTSASLTCFSALMMGISPASPVRHTPHQTH